MSSNSVTISGEIGIEAEPKVRPSLGSRVSAVACSGARTLVVALILAATVTLLIAGDTSRFCSFLTRTSISGVSSSRGAVVSAQPPAGAEQVPPSSGAASTNCSYREHCCGAAVKPERSRQHRNAAPAGTGRRNARPNPLHRLVASWLVVNFGGESIGRTCVNGPIARIVTRIAN